MADEKSPLRISHRLFATSCLETRSIMEIERKYLVSEVPANLKDYHCRVIEPILLYGSEKITIPII